MADAGRWAVRCGPMRDLAPDHPHEVITEVRLLTPTEVQSILRISSDTLGRWSAQGRLEPIRFNRTTVRYRFDDLVAFIDGQSGRVQADDVLDRALALLAEQHADDERPVCPSCAKRRVDRHGDFCSSCVDDHERSKAAKRRWWAEHGKEWRDGRRSAG